MEKISHFTSHLHKDKNKSFTQGGPNKGCQNNNGLILEEFMQENILFASNTAFKKQSKKKTTWVGNLKGKTVYICGNDSPAKNILEKALKNSKRKRGRPLSALLNTLIFEMNYLKLKMENIEKIDKDAYPEIIRTHC